MQTVDEGKLFQTDAQLNLAEARRQKSLADQKPNVDNGFPIVLSSKPLRIVIDGDDAYVAENGFVAQRIDLKSGKVKATFRGHTGPVTSLALFTQIVSPQQNRKILFTGSWDKTIKVWDIETQVLLSTSTGHVDFVKSIHIIPHFRILVSGSTDREIRLWRFQELLDHCNWSDVDLQYRERKQAQLEAKRAKSATGIPTDNLPTGTPDLSQPGSTQFPSAIYGPIPNMVILKSHTRPIDSIASYPTVESTEEETYNRRKDGTAPYLLVSADSMGALKVWLVRSSSQDIEPILDSTTWPHKTSITDIQIGCEVRHEVDHQTTAQLWTASADNSVLRSALDLLPSSDKRVVNVLRIEQPYFIRCLLNLPLFFGGQPDSEPTCQNWLITGSTDESIRLYDLESIEDKKFSTVRGRFLDKPGSSADLDVISDGWFGCLKAHWHEVNCLGIWVDSQTKKRWLLSSGLDGTLRRWELTELQQRFSSQPKKSVISQTPPIQQNPSLQLTAEEEAELAEIMGQLDEEVP